MRIDPTDPYRATSAPVSTDSSGRTAFDPALERSRRRRHSKGDEEMTASAMMPLVACAPFVDPARAEFVPHVVSTKTRADGLVEAAQARPLVPIDGIGAAVRLSGGERVDVVVRDTTHGVELTLAAPRSAATWLASDRPRIAERLAVRGIRLLACVVVEQSGGQRR